MNVQIIRSTGQTETKELRFSQIEKEIGADILDTVNLRDGRIMLVDDLGHRKGLPINAEATRLYHSVCKPGTTHQIVGDVAIVVDAEVDA